MLVAVHPQTPRARLLGYPTCPRRPHGASSAHPGTFITSPSLRITHIPQVNLFWGQDGPYPEAISTAIETCARLEILRVLVYDAVEDLDWRMRDLHEDTRVKRCVPASPAVKMWSNYLDGSGPGCWSP